MSSLYGLNANSITANHQHTAWIRQIDDGVGTVFRAGALHIEDSSIPHHLRDALEIILAEQALYLLHVREEVRRHGTYLLFREPPVPL